MLSVARQVGRWLRAMCWEPCTGVVWALVRAVVLAETLAVAVHVARIGCAPSGGAPWAVGVVVRRIARSVAAVGCSARSVEAVGCSTWLVAAVGCGARPVAVVVVRTELVAVWHGRRVHTGR